MPLKYKELCVCIVLCISRFLAHDINLLKTVKNLLDLSSIKDQSCWAYLFFFARKQPQEWMGSASFNNTLIPQISLTFWKVLDIQTDAPQVSKRKPQNLSQPK